MKKTLFLLIMVLSMTFASGCSKKITEENQFDYVYWSFVSYKEPTGIPNFYNIRYEGYVGPKYPYMTLKDVKIEINTITQSFSDTINERTDYQFYDKMQYSPYWYPINNEFIVNVTILSGRVKD
ncbi:hypothetical protein [Peloplasma aerotolerans]|uniref:Lipoprotein n=1 Tax=Peloplasma aerotolerans TaxID=3044389 RepID=A0AAW6UBI3_9MOLU|nr:hypothetical protein [Mariniplasma sp. M4Ah]MDI6453543.1 hypothetical protein [Mariniplasma sp. M4Ah]